MERLSGSSGPSEIEPCVFLFTHRRSPLFPALDESSGIGDGGGGGISASPVEAELSLGMQQSGQALPDCEESDSDTGSLWDQPVWCDGGVIGSAAMPTICHVSQSVLVHSNACGVNGSASLSSMTACIPFPVIPGGSRGCSSAVDFWIQRTSRKPQHRYCRCSGDLSVISASPQAGPRSSHRCVPCCERRRQ